MRPFRLALQLLLSAPLFGANEPVIAFIKDAHVFTSTADASNVKQLGNDARPKSMLAWDRHRRRISFLVPSQEGELARLVAIDLSGKIVLEIPIRPPTNPPTYRMRFVEGVSWRASGRVRIWGSINPSNCEIFDLDGVNGKESNWNFGACGTFVTSPDERHEAGLGPVQQFTTEDQRFNTLEIDNKENLYPPPGTGDIFIVAGPMWSPDSQKVAILEKRAGSGEAAVALVTSAGTFTRLAVSNSVLDDPSLEWVGAVLVTGHRDTDEIQIDSTTKRTGGVTADVRKEKDRLAAARGRLQSRHINGTGITVGNQILQDYAPLRHSCLPLPPGGVMDDKRSQGNTYQAVPSVSGACGKTLYSGTSVATYLGPNDKNSQFACSSKILLLDGSGNTANIRAVQDRCAPSGCGNDLPHIDTYTSALACNPGAIPDLPRAFAISVK